MASYVIRLKGGAGSGFHGHKGRPGFVGGSSAEDTSSSSVQTPDESGLDPYSKDLIDIGKKATALGIKSFTDKRIVQDIARGAAELINSRTKVGYTVYGSDMSHLSEDGTHDLGSFPMVAYGAETPKQVKSMIDYLKGFGYKAMLGSENYGILVSPMNTSVLEEYWAGQKEFIGKTYGIKLKGGAGSGNHGHKGIPGHRGGSLPQGSSVSDSSTFDESVPSDVETGKPLSDVKAVKKAKVFLDAMYLNVEYDEDLKSAAAYLSNKYLGTSLDENEVHFKTAQVQIKKLLALPSAELLKLAKDDWESLLNAGQYLGDF
ncbi:MAG: hypothetical protein WC479_05250 [Candidatus Izemoplasmatales bacterium]